MIQQFSVLKTLNCGLPGSGLCISGDHEPAVLSSENPKLRSPGQQDGTAICFGELQLLRVVLCCVVVVCCCVVNPRRKKLKKTHLKVSFVRVLFVCGCHVLCVVCNVLFVVLLFFFYLCVLFFLCVVFVFSLASYFVCCVVVVCCCVVCCCVVCSCVVCLLCVVCVWCVVCVVCGVCVCVLFGDVAQLDLRLGDFVLQVSDDVHGLSEPRTLGMQLHATVSHVDGFHSRHDGVVQVQGANCLVASSRHALPLATASKQLQTTLPLRQALRKVLGVLGPNQQIVNIKEDNHQPFLVFLQKIVGSKICENPWFPKCADSSLYQGCRNVTRGFRQLQLMLSSRHDFMDLYNARRQEGGGINFLLAPTPSCW